MRFLLTAGEYDAAEVSRTGLAQEVVPAGAHVQRAADLAHLIAQRAPLGVLATLASASAGLGRGPDAARGCVASLLPGIMRSQDAADGLRSFTEQPEARFTGHRPVPAGRLLRALRPHPLGRRRLLVVPRTRRSVLDVEPTPERSALQIIGAIIHGLGASDSLLFVAIAWRQLEVKVTASGCPESGLARRQGSIEWGWGYLPPAGGASYEPFARSRQAPDQPHLPIEGVAEVPWPRQVNVA